MGDELFCDDDAPQPPDQDEAVESRPPVAQIDAARLAALIKRIAAQDEAALAALYDATLGRVYGLALRILRDPMAAEEVAEDVYFAVWQQAVRYDPTRGRPLGWLLVIARSRALDQLRRREPAFAHPEPGELLDVEPCEAVSAAQLIDAARDAARLHAALGRLEALPRQMVALAFFRGLSHEEIARHAQLPLGTVKSHIRRALASLKGALLAAPAGSPSTS